MHRIDSTGAVSVAPTPREQGQTVGYFTGGDPTIGQSATVVSYEWANAVQEEIVGVILEADLTLNKTDNGQLKEAINILQDAKIDSKVLDTITDEIRTVAIIEADLEDGGTTQIPSELAVAEAIEDIFEEVTTAQTTANTAVTNAATAQSTAETAQSTANSAVSGLEDKADIDLSNISDTGKNVCANMAMPSDTYIDLTYAAGTSYTAPADGYFLLYGSSDSTATTNHHSGLSIGNYTYAQSVYGAGMLLCVWAPVKKGDIATTIQTRYSNTYFRFIYAEGSQPTDEGDE